MVRTWNGLLIFFLCVVMGEGVYLEVESLGMLEWMNQFGRLLNVSFE